MNNGSTPSDPPAAPDTADAATHPSDAAHDMVTPVDEASFGDEASELAASDDIADDDSDDLEDTAELDDDAGDDSDDPAELDDTAELDEAAGEGADETEELDETEVAAVDVEPEPLPEGIPVDEELTEITADLDDVETVLAQLDKANPELDEVCSAAEADGSLAERPALDAFWKVKSRRDA